MYNATGAAHPGRLIVPCIRNASPRSAFLNCSRSVSTSFGCTKGGSVWIYRTYTCKRICVCILSVRHYSSHALVFSVTSFVLHVCMYLLSLPTTNRVIHSSMIQIPARRSFVITVPCSAKSQVSVCLWNQADCWPWAISTSQGSTWSMAMIPDDGLFAVSSLAIEKVKSDDIYIFMSVRSLGSGSFSCQRAQIMQSLSQTIKNKILFMLPSPRNADPTLYYPLFILICCKVTAIKTKSVSIRPRNFFSKFWVSDDQLDQLGWLSTKCHTHQSVRLWSLWLVSIIWSHFPINGFSAPTLLPSTNFGETDDVVADSPSACSIFDWSDFLAFHTHD